MAPGVANCYWERVSDFGGEFSALIANDLGPTPAIVDIAPTDAGFRSDQCGTWTRIG